METIDRDSAGGKGAQFHNVFGDSSPVPLKDTGDDEECLRVPGLFNPSADGRLQQLVSPFRSRKPQCGAATDLVEGPGFGSIHKDAIMVLELGGNLSMSPLKSGRCDRHSFKYPLCFCMEGMLQMTPSDVQPAAEPISTLINHM